MTVQSTDRFTLVREVIQCRFSTVYEAVERDGNTPVLLRRASRVAAETNAYPLVKAQLAREGRLLQTLDNPHLPRVRETVIDDAGDVTIVMDPFDGHALDYVVTNLSGAPGQHLLGRWMHQLATALQVLHERGAVFRDLRPQSVVLTSAGQIMLVDFGLAWMGQSEEEDGPFRGHGAPHFAPPEQFQDGTPDPRMDLYAMGATFHYLATGRKPPTSQDRLLHETPIENVSVVNTRLTPQFGEVLTRLMALDAAQRPADVNAFLDLIDLADVASAVHFAHTPPVAATWKAPTAKQPKVEPEPVVETPPADAETSRKGLLSFLPWKSKRTDTARVITEEWTEEDLERFPRVEMSTFPLDRETAKLLPEDIAKRVGGICIGRQSSRELTVVVKRPDVYIYDHISYATGGQFKPVLMLADDHLIDLAYEYVYKVPERQHHVPWREWLEKKRFHGQDLALIQSEEQEALLQMDDVKGPAIDAVDRMIKEAISIRASDIHIETYENDVVLRYRIDGILHVMDTWPRRDAAAYIKRVKIMANMDIAQEMLPQGGRISVRVSDQEFDLRVSCVPVPDGESIVMRLLPKGTFDMKLEDLGFGAENLVIFRKLVSQPHGMLLVSGPTGSGKSTTLYATLAEINLPDRKILTVEDPIEYKMHGVVQVQVNTTAREDEKRLTFARALREFLRQDPDVILVGEIRDDETAAISVQAALTGHLLLSTVHTNDAVTIITRLRDRGVEPFLISSTMIGGIAQRLVRKICEGCKEEIPLHPTARRMFETEGIDVPRVYTGRGCVQCHRTGYRGRIAIYEVLEINDELRDMVASNVNAGDIMRAAKRYGMNTLFYDGLLKVKRGVVTLEEVKRVCMTI